MKSKFRLFRRISSFKKISQFFCPKIIMDKWYARNNPHQLSRFLNTSCLFLVKSVFVILARTLFKGLHYLHRFSIFFTPIYYHNAHGFTFWFPSLLISSFASLPPNSHRDPLARRQVDVDKGESFSQFLCNGSLPPEGLGQLGVAQGGAEDADHLVPGTAYEGGHVVEVAINAGEAGDLL